MRYSIGEGSTVGRYTVIGKGCVIGKGTKVWHWVNIMDGAKVGDGCMIGSYVQLDPRVTIGDRVRIQPKTVVSADSVIGDDSFVSVAVMFLNSRHPPSHRLQPQRIGKRAILGAGVILAPGAFVGDDSVVIAGSIVDGEVPSGQVWGGSPARALSTIDEWDRKKEEWEADA